MEYPGGTGPIGSGVYRLLFFGKGVVMFSLNSKRFNMKLRFTPGGVVMVSLCLLTAVLFLGCPQPTSSGSDNPAPNLPPAQTASYMSMDAMSTI